MKKFKTFHEVPVFKEIQLSKQAEKQFRFLKAVHPFLSDDNWSDGCVEIRPRRRAPGGYLRSHNFWHLHEKDTEFYKTFLAKPNGKGYCLYFSGYAFDYHKETFKDDGKKH